MFAVQNDVLIGVLTGEYGLFTALSASHAVSHNVFPRSEHLLAIKNSLFTILYLVLFMASVPHVINFMIDFIVACC